MRKTPLTKAIRDEIVANIIDKTFTKRVDSARQLASDSVREAIAVTIPKPVLDQFKRNPGFFYSVNTVEIVSYKDDDSGNWVRTCLNFKPVPMLEGERHLVYTWESCKKYLQDKGIPVEPTRTCVADLLGLLQKRRDARVTARSTIYAFRNAEDLREALPECADCIPEIEKPLPLALNIKPLQAILRGAE